MSVNVNCDACGSEFSVGDAYRGKRIKCKACGEPVRIPLDDDDEPALIASPKSSRSGSKSPKKRKGKGKSSSALPLILGGVAAGLVVVGVLGVVVVRSFSRPQALAETAATQTAATQTAATQTAATEPAATEPANPTAVASTSTDTASSRAVSAGTAGSEAEFVAALKEANQARFDSISILKSIRTVGDIPAAQKKMLALGDQGFAASRRALEIQASGKITADVIKRLKDADLLERNRATDQMGEAMSALRANRELELGISAMTRALAEHRGANERSLPPELYKLLTTQSGDSGQEALAKILPVGLSAKELTGMFNNFATEHGAEHCVVLIGISARKEYAAFFERRMKELTKNEFVYCRNLPIKIDGIEHTATIAYLLSLETRQEVLDAIDVGEITARDDNSGVFVIRDTKKYSYRPGAGPVVKNSGFVWDGYWPSGTITRSLNPDTAIVVRLDGVQPFKHPRLGDRVAAKILGTTDANFEEGDYKTYYYITLNGPANFDDFVKQASAVAPVVRTVPERRVIILQIDPAKFPMP